MRSTTKRIAQVEFSDSIQLAEVPDLIEPLADVLPKTESAIKTGIEQGWHLGAQVCVWQDGSLLANAGVGTIDGSVPMDADALNLWLSSGKPIGAVAVKLLERDGLLNLDEPVSIYWPEFGTNGKEAITTRHILTHTAGIRTADIAGSYSDFSEVLLAIANARIEPDWVPGKRAGYHAFGGWQVIGELVRRLNGSDYDEFVRERIFDPLSMNSSTFGLFSMPSMKLRDRVVPMHMSKRGEFGRDPQFSPEFVSSFPRPGGGLHSTASDMVRFYRMLLGFGELEGQKLLEPSDVVEITSPQRTGMKDMTFGQVMDWGLGVMFDNKIHGSATPYGYGAHASQRTFGHGGRESSSAFADPEHDLAVALVFNAMPGEPTHDRRLRLVTAAIYEDLALV